MLQTVWSLTPSAFGSFGIVPELTNRQILLRRRPTGLVQPGDTELVTNPAPEPAEGEALLRTTYVGMDAAARTWLDGQPGYLPRGRAGRCHPGGGHRRGGGVALRRIRRRRRRHHADGLSGIRDHPRRRVQHAHSRGDRPTGDHVRLWPDRRHRLLRDDRHRQAPAGGDRGGVGRGGRHRVGGRADRQDRRRAGGGYRGRPAQVQGGGRRLRVRRVHRLQGGQPPRGAQGTLPEGCERLLRQRRRADPRRGARAGWPTRRGSCSAASSPAT